MKSNSERAVFGIYGKPEAVGTVVDRLLSGGFSPSAISVLLQNREDARRLTQATKTGAAETAVESSRSAIADRGFALFAGLAELDVPDAGMFLAAGRIMIILAGGTAGRPWDSLAGALIGMGVPEYEAKLFEGAVKDGSTLLSVHCDGSEQLRGAKSALEATGAVDVASTIEAIPDDTAVDRGDAARLSAEEAQEQSEVFVAGRKTPQPLNFKPGPAIS